MARQNMFGFVILFSQVWNNLVSYLKEHPTTLIAQCFAEYTGKNSDFLENPKAGLKTPAYGLVRKDKKFSTLVMQQLPKIVETLILPHVENMPTWDAAKAWKKVDFKSFQLICMLAAASVEQQFLSSYHKQDSKKELEAQASSLVGGVFEDLADMSAEEQAIAVVARMGDFQKAILATLKANA